MKKPKGTIRVAMVPFVERGPRGEEGQIQYQPALPVRVRGARFILERHARIDTGATTCLIDQRIIEKEASVDLAEGLLLLAGVGGTQYVPHYRFDLDICGPEFETVKTFSHVSFLAVDLPLGSDIVLGLQGVLENLRLTFDYPRRQVELEFARGQKARSQPSYMREAESLFRSGNYGAAILEFSFVIESFLANVAHDLGEPMEPKTTTLGPLTEHLRRQGFLDERLVAMLREFAKLRNVAVHALGTIALPDAERSLELAEQTMSLLRAKRKRERVSLALSAVKAKFLPESDLAIEYIDNLSNSEDKRRRELFATAMTYSERGRHSDAAACLKEALETGASGPEKIALLILLGATHIKSGRISEATLLYKTAVEEAQGVQDKVGLAAALANLGIANKLAGDLVEAQRNIGMAIALCEQIDFTEGKIHLLASLANVNMNLGRHEAARQYFEAATALANSVEARHPYTSRHMMRVAETARKIATEMGLSRDQRDTIQLAALLHDIGKIAIPETVLYKTGSLTQSEVLIIESHPALGGMILGRLEELSNIIPIIRCHHENYDGSGYPEGLKGDAIPIGARILAVADVYDALTSVRPYRGSYTDHQALAEILQDGGRGRLDPEVVEAFSKVLVRSQEAT